MIDREAAIKAVMQKLLDLYGPMDVWGDDGELSDDAEQIYMVAVGETPSEAPRD